MNSVQPEETTREAPTRPVRPSRIRSFAWFILAVFYYIFAVVVARIAAHGLAFGEWFYFADRAILLFLLIIGFAAMGFIGQRQRHPVKDMGLWIRPGGWGEFALGSAIGWAGVTVCALMILIFGGMVVVYYTGARQYEIELPLDIAILLVASLGEEVAFRGYPFQRLIEATNAPIATLLLSAAYAIVHFSNPAASLDSTLVTMFAGWVFSIAYLRTRALWVGWGLHFGWNASMAVLFGLPLSGVTRFSPVISSTAIGPTWLTGFDYGPEGSVVAIVVVLALVFAVTYTTRDLDYEYGQPVIVAGGIPVDIDDVARRQHEAAMGPAQPAPPQIVQIEGVQPQENPPQQADEPGEKRD